MRTPPRLIQAFYNDVRPTDSIGIGIGDRSDYAALAPLHYRSGPPATMQRVIAARDTRSGALAGVLLISRPTLNGSWRRRAWPGSFDGRDKRAIARRINEQLRTISRVIVDPRYRGIGVGVGLVRVYLGSPLTIRTEAIAAMGSISPFFERAGMRRIDSEPSARDLSLLRALRRLGWSEDSNACAMRLLRCDDPELERPLFAWAQASPSTRRLAKNGFGSVAQAAAGALLAPPMAYAYDAD